MTSLFSYILLFVTLINTANFNFTLDCDRKTYLQHTIYFKMLSLSITPGDRIISVNGISLEESTHEQAAEILKRAGNKLDLVVSKTPSNVSLLGT